MIPFLKVSGSHYEIGFQVGSQMRRQINDFVSKSRSLQEVMIPFYSTSEGEVLFEKTETLLRAQLPFLVREVEGLAAGAGLPFKTIMLLNINMPSGSKGILDKGCTTLIVGDGERGCQVMGHTEDGPFEAENNMYLVEVDIPASEELEAEHFIGLSYPGSLVGRALGFNIKEGFAWSMNALTPRQVTHGIPRQFVLRTLAGQGLAAFLGKMKLISNGCSVNIADKNTAINIEVAPKRHHLMVLADSTIVKTNKYQNLKVAEVRDIHVESSLARLKRIDAEDVKNEDDVRRWLGDQEGELSVFRTNTNNKDVLLTFATGIFNIKKGSFQLYSRNPRYSDPDFTKSIELKDCLTIAIESLS